MDQKGQIIRSQDIDLFYTEIWNAPNFSKIVIEFRTWISKYIHTYRMI